MREILFRGKRCDNGEWVEGYYVKANHHWHKYGIHKDWIICGASANGGWFALHSKFPVKSESVGQYTGLTANGTKIFEGDIFEDRADNSLALVMFKDGCFRLEWYGMRGGGWGVLDCDPIDWYCVHDMKVIGNIYDNPELLKGEGND